MYNCRFTSEQLNRLPLNTVIDSEDLIPVRRPPSPGPIIVTEIELQVILLSFFFKRAYNMLSLNFLYYFAFFCNPLLRNAKFRKLL